MYEIRQLLASAKAARRRDPTVPTFTPSSLRRGSTRKPAVVTPPSPPAPPAPPHRDG